MMAAPTHVGSLYAHVPFCAQKCDYCAFYSEPSSGGLIQRYVQALSLELERVADHLDPVTIFFGGGTPSLLNTRQWQFLFKTMERLGLNGAREWTIECNPATVSIEKARLWKDAGVNRVSLGVQSLDEALLDRLGRIHSREMVFKSFDLLRRAGFDNINLDLMFAIPGQSQQTWRSTLEEALAMESEHLACYELIYEEDTPLFQQLQAGQVEVDESLAAAMYEDFLDRSAQAGFLQYEIANFAKDKPSQEPSQDPFIPSLACRHNINYWRGGSYHGIGPSAAGFVGGDRTKNVSNTERYCELLEQGLSPREWTENLPPLGRAAEIAAFGLRMNVGWAFEEFRSTTGFELKEEWGNDLRQLVSQGWGEMSPDRFRLSRQGMRFADAAAQLLLRP